MNAVRLAFLLGLTAASVLWSESTPREALLVLSKGDHTLAIVDPSTLKVVAKAPVGQDPHEVVASTDGKVAYVSIYGGGAYNTIDRIDLIGQQRLPSIDLGPLRGPHGLMFVGGKTWFTAEAAKAIGSYDPAKGAVDWILGTGQDRTHMIFVTGDTKRIFTTNVSSATVSIIEQGAAQGPGPGRGPGGPPPGGRGGAPDWNVTSIPVGRGSEGFDLSPDGKELWVANAQDSTISVIDVASKKVIQTLPSTGSANRLKISLDGKYVFVSDLNGNDLLVLDAATRKEHKRIALPASSEGLLMAPDGSHAYTTLNSRDAVAVIDLKTLTVTGEVKTGRGPDGLAWAARK